MNRVIRLLVATLGVFAGIGIFVGVISLLTAIGVVHEIPWLMGWMLVGAYFIAGVIGGLFFYIIYPKLEALVRKIGAVLDAQMSKIPTKDVVFASVGLIVGLIIALLLSTLINQIPIPWLSTPLSIVVYLVMAYLGVDVALKRKGELGSMTEAVAAKQSGERKQKASRQDRNVPPRFWIPAPSSTGASTTWRRLASSTGGSLSRSLCWGSCGTLLIALTPSAGKRAEGVGYPVPAAAGIPQCGGQRQGLRGD